MSIKRGALIVVEGVDRTGKSTQAKALVDSLMEKQVKAQYTNFPERSTEIGKLISAYLTSKKELSDETIHLLFSANRWEKANNIIKTLESGITLVIDRYCYSGVAFSTAKGLDMKWCKAPDAGLPLPDKVFFLTMPMEHIQQRKGFGEERYEIPEFQKKVSDAFLLLKEDNWDVIDASRSKEEIHRELLDKTFDVINCNEHKPVSKIWK